MLKCDACGSEMAMSDIITLAMDLMDDGFHEVCLKCHNSIADCILKAEEPHIEAAAQARFDAIKLWRITKPVPRSKGERDGREL